MLVLNLIKLNRNQINYVHSCFVTSYIVTEQLHTTSSQYKITLAIMLYIYKQTDWLLGKVIQSQIKSCTILRSPLPQSAGMSAKGGIYRDLRLLHCLCFNYKLYELCKPLLYLGNSIAFCPVSQGYL